MDLSTLNLALLFSASAFVISVFSFFFFKSYLKRRTGQERILAEFREEVNHILESIDETTDRDISIFEEKEKVLKNLLAEIEKRHKVYIRDMEKYQSAITAPPSAEKVSYQELGKNRYRLNMPPANESDSAVKARETARKISPDPGQAFPLPNFSVTPDESDSPTVKEQIRSLVKAGFSSPVIASRLGISIAEVEFEMELLKY